jgi:hypothetical protein
MTEKPQSEQSLDSGLDETLEMTFPAAIRSQFIRRNPPTRPLTTEEISFGGPVSATLPPSREHESGRLQPLT